MANDKIEYVKTSVSTPTLNNYFSTSNSKTGVPYAKKETEEFDLSSYKFTSKSNNSNNMSDGIIKINLGNGMKGNIDKKYVDFSRITDSHENAKNGKFIDSNKVYDSYWNNNLEYEVENDGVVLLKSNGVPMGRTTISAIETKIGLSSQGSSNNSNKISNNIEKSENNNSTSKATNVNDIVDSEGKKVFQIKALDTGEKVVCDVNGKSLTEIDKNIKYKTYTDPSDGAAVYEDTANNKKIYVKDGKIDFVEMVIKGNGTTQTDTSVDFQVSNDKVIGVSYKVDSTGRGDFFDENRLYGVKKKLTNIESGTAEKNVKLDVNDLNNQSKSNINDNDQIIVTDNDDCFISVQVNGVDYKINTDAHWWYAYKNNQGVNLNADMDSSKDLYRWNYVNKDLRNVTYGKKGMQMVYSEKKELHDGTIQYLTSSGEVIKTILPNNVVIIGINNSDVYLPNGDTYRYEKGILKSVSYNDGTLVRFLDDGKTIDKVINSNGVEEKI